VKVFHCSNCNHLLFFENVQCVSCGSQLAYAPDAADMVTVPAHEGETWAPGGPSASPLSLRLCANYVEYQTCNWAIDARDAERLCRSCRLSRVIPELTDAGVRNAWYKLETAKRRLIFTLLALKLPIVSRDQDPAGLSFEFKADPSDPGAPRVLTGHANGVITVSLAEADDAERERRRQGLGEPYRTLLGHMRHESGHYYWDRLIRDSAALEPFRTLFGDEQQDYGAALRQHYQNGPPADWQNAFVSSYASSHPWEDWAETWAHYLHMVDALETAADNGLVLRPRRADEPALPRLPDTIVSGRMPFDRLIDSWFALTYALNNLNRSLGQPDGYPFVLSTAAVQKLRFVHDVVTAAGAGACA
jgi:hypothetical protein